MLRAGGGRDTALLLWAGAATLTVRGSQKAKIGKVLERAIARTALTLLGLCETDGDFRLNVQADGEVERETDAEVRTPRGTVRIEVGLIGVGNPEVIGDKINRVGRNGVILFDILPARSSMWENAVGARVKLIQMRNSHPVEDLRQHLKSLGVAVQDDPVDIHALSELVMELPLTVFE